MPLRMNARSAARAASPSSNASQPPSEAGAKVPSMYSIPSASTPEEKRAAAAAASAARAHLASAARAHLRMPHNMTTRSMTRAAATRCNASIPSTVSAPTPEKTLRDYQSRIAWECESENTLVVIPTGAGKTMIAAEVIKRLPPRGLFLVPTRILVEQQAKVLRSWNCGEVGELKGGEKLPHESFDVLVATPEAFMAALESPAPHVQWSEFKVVVFDEVHHVIKEHPYRKLALDLQRWSFSRPPSASLPSSSHTPRVLGLTASYCYDIGDARAKASLAKMCEELLITNTATTTREELEAGRYHATGAAAEVLPPPATVTPSGVLPKADRILQQAATFLRREEMGENTNFARRLMTCVRSMEDAIKATEYPDFVSPLVLTGDVSVTMWGAYAHKLAHHSRGAGLRRTATSRGRRNNHQQPNPSSHRPQLAELEHWYEAVKTLVVSWEEREDHAATILDMFGCTGSATSRKSKQQQEKDVWPGWVLQKIRAFWEEVPETFPRYEQLKKVLLEKYEHHGGDGNTNGGGRRSSGGSAASNGGGKAFRGIVFVRQRVTTHVLAHVIANDPRLAPRFSTACLHATSSTATASLGLSEQEAKASIEAFRSGRVNLLLTTVVAEEGMDVPAANCVVRYDAMEHAVSMVQGRGRAREEGSSFVVLDERADRTTADLEAVARRHGWILETFDPQPLGSTAEEVVDQDPIEPDDATITDAGSADTWVEPDESIVEVLVPLSAITGLPVEPGNMAAATASDDVRLVTQQSLELGARGVLLDVQARHGLGVGMTPNGTPIPPPGVLSAVEMFEEKTNAVLTETFEQEPESGWWVCTLSYTSALRELHAPGEAASGKKIARKLAAARLVADLIGSTAPAEPDDAASSGAGRTGTWVEPDEDFAEVVEPLSACAHDIAEPRSTITDDLVEPSAGSMGPAAASDDACLTTLQSLETEARGVLLDVQARHGLGVGMSPNGTPIPPPGVLSAVDLFAEKTHTVVKETFEQEPESGRWVCTLSYESALRELHAPGEAASGKKIARTLAAARLVADLLDEVPA